MMEPLPCTAICKSSQKPCGNKARLELDGLPLCKLHYNQMKPPAECPICLASCSRGDVITIECTHVFHKSCLQKWLQNADTCPLCRTQMSTKTMCALNKNIIDGMTWAIFSMDREHRNELLYNIETLLSDYFNTRNAV